MKVPVGHNQKDAQNGKDQAGNLRDPGCPVHENAARQQNHDRGQVLQNCSDAGGRKLNGPEIGVLAEGNAGRAVDKQQARGPLCFPYAEQLVSIFEEAVYE